MADGFLMFGSLETYVKRTQIPVISRDQFLSSELTYDSYVTRFSHSTDFYLKTEEGLERLGDKTDELSDLPEGTYLIVMDCSAAHDSEYYRFCYLLWLN